MIQHKRYKVKSEYELFLDFFNHKSCFLDGLSVLMLIYLLQHLINCIRVASKILCN